MIDVDKYNLIFNTENPLLSISDPDSAYFDYHDKIYDTNTYNTCSFIPDECRSYNKSMNNDAYIGNLMLLYYASLFELFSLDGIVDSFYRFFTIYCEEVCAGTKGPLFQDDNGDTMFHYAAYSFECRDAINALYSSVLMENPTITNPMFIKNKYGVTPNDILMLE